MRYLMEKFQLYLRKLIIQAFQILVQVTIALAGLNGRQVSKSPFNYVLSCSFQKNKHFKMLIA